MAQTLAQTLYLGPFAVYTSPTGLTDNVTGIPMLGGDQHEGNYVDVTREEVNQWNTFYGSKLNTGRYRLVRLSTLANTANIAYGKPAAWGFPSKLGQVAIVGTGTVTNAVDGQYAVSSTTDAASGSFPASTAAVAVVQVSGGAIIGAQLSFPGANMRTVPTFSLSEINGYTGPGGPLVGQMDWSPNLVTSFDASTPYLSSPRGVFLTTVTAAQILANAWVVIQELGVAPVLLTTAGTTTPGATVTAVTGGLAQTGVATAAPVGGFMGYTLDTSAVNTVSRVDLALPTRQG